jgi:hypothetical protein
MWYLIGLISGVVAGIAMFWIIPLAKKDTEKYMKFGKFSAGEMKFFTITGFIVSTFLIGPFMSYMYSRRLTYEGQEAFWEHATFITVITVSLLGFFLISFFYNIRNKENIIKSWKSILIIYLVFAFSFGWLIPILYKWFAG